MQVRCAEVARTLADLEASEECIAAALLHSVLDSSMLTEEKLRMSMCAEVADTVFNVHKLSGICQVTFLRLVTEIIQQCSIHSCDRGQQM